MSDQDLIDKLRRELTLSQEENDSLKTKNQRLSEKLQSSQTYAEELRLQVEKLQRNLSLKSEALDADTQTVEADLNEASYLWHLASDQKDDSNADDLRASLVAQVREAAQETAQQEFLKGMVYEETSGLYYDYKSGYYYDAVRSLYYDGNSGTYYKYNYDTKEYEVHSRTEIKATGKQKKKKKEPKEDALEDGEVSSDEDSESTSTSITSNPTSPVTVEQAPKIRPALRLVVIKSEDLDVGTLFLVTCQGASVGRHQRNDVVLEVQGCSQSHGSISSQEDKFFYKDLKSTNGTIVNKGKVVTGDLVEIGHGTEIEIGTTRFKCHVHPGLETCNDCEPGLIIKSEPSQAPVVSREKQRKKELQKLKSKYGLKGADVDQSQNAYVNRAAKRRKEIGSDNPYEKTETAHPDKMISTQNKGFKLLSKMGWKTGEGLGKESAGRVEPVQVEMRAERAGLGSSDHQPPPQATKSGNIKAEVWRKTQDRFASISKSDNV